MLYDMFMFHDFDFRRLQRILGGSYLIVGGIVSIMITICVFRCTGRSNDQDAMKELVRDVRDVYQDVSNNGYSIRTKIC